MNLAHQDHHYKKLQEGPGRSSARRLMRWSRLRANTHDKAPIQEYKEWTLADALQRVVTGWVILCIYLHSFICGVIYKAFVCARLYRTKNS